MPRRILSLILPVLLVVTMAACMGDDDGDDENTAASPVADVTAEDVLEASRDAWAETESAHFVLEIDGDAYLDEDETLKLVSAEGDIKRPGSVAAAATVDAQISVVDISLVAVDGDIYITNLLSGNWEHAPDDFSYDPSVLFSDTEGIGPIMTDLQNPEVEGTEDVNGQSAYRVTGTVPADRVAEITAGTIAGDEIEVTLWTGVEDAKLLRVVLTEPEGIRESPATWTLNLTEHGKEIEIDAPVVPTRTP
ncbi:MAG TPA: LppX_LprAFG lipoprotein [Thermomicrobiales bacterium]|nr:LppX_LprAFG lipoprotein [Thermomicrobiales bacterium]